MFVWSRLIVCHLLSTTYVTYLASRSTILVPCTAPEQEWNNILIRGLTIGAGDVSPEELYAVLKKRIERTLIRTVRQSYAFLHLVHLFFCLLLNWCCSFHLSMLSLLVGRWWKTKEGGSYQQRILTEYLKGIETRAYEIAQVLQGKQQ